MAAGYKANGEPPPTQPGTPTTPDCVGRFTVIELRWVLVHCRRVLVAPGARSADAVRGGVRLTCVMSTRAWSRRCANLQGNRMHPLVLNETGAASAFRTALG